MAEEAASADLMASTATVHVRTRVRGLVRARHAAAAVAPGAIRRVRLRAHRPRRLGEVAVVVVLVVVVVAAALGEAPVQAIRRLRGAAVVGEVRGGVAARVIVVTAATAGAGAGARGDEGGGRWIMEGTGEDPLRGEPRGHAQPLSKQGLRVNKETAFARIPATLCERLDEAKQVRYGITAKSWVTQGEKPSKWSWTRTKKQRKTAMQKRSVERWRNRK